MIKTARHHRALFLVIDQGGHSSRALVFDATGAVVCQAQCAVDTVNVQPGWFEQDAAQILLSVQQVLQSVAQQLGAQSADIQSAGLIVQRSSVVAWHRHTGSCLYPVLSWQDTRNSRWLDERITGQHDTLRALTGLRPNAHYGASKIRWLLDHVDAVQQALHDGVLCIAPLASFLHWQLVSSAVPAAAIEPVVDGVLAARTLLTESGSLHWSSELLALFEIPEQILPVIKPTLADYGCVLVGDTQVPLRLLGGDQSFVALAYGNTHAEAAFINVGTGAFIQRLCNANTVSYGKNAPEKLLCSALMVNANGSVIIAMEGTVNAAASALDWLWQQHASTLDVHTLEATLQQTVSNSSSVPIFLNRITASGSPDWLPAGESSFSFAAPLPILAVAVLESIVFSLQRNLDVIQDTLSCEHVVISGGLSRLNGFCQRLANVSALSVLRSDDVEASARGAALQLIPEKMELHLQWRHFYPQAQPLLAARYEAWSNAMHALSHSQ
jgi:glycerol kinase